MKPVIKKIYILNYPLNSCRVKAVTWLKHRPMQGNPRQSFFYVMFLPKEHLRTCWNVSQRSRSNWNLEVLVFKEREFRTRVTLAECECSHHYPTLAPRLGFQFLSVELEFWIPIVIISGIPKTLGCIPGCQSSGLWIPQAKFSRIPVSSTMLK